MSTRGTWFLEPYKYTIDKLSQFGPFGIIIAFIAACILAASSIIEDIQRLDTAVQAFLVLAFIAFVFYRDSEMKRRSSEAKWEEAKTQGESQTQRSRAQLTPDRAQSHNSPGNLKKSLPNQSKTDNPKDSTVVPTRPSSTPAKLRSRGRKK
jgi:hypothetical protein